MVDAGAGSSTVQVSGGQLALTLRGFGDVVFLHGKTDAAITDLSRGMSLSIDSDAVVASISGFNAGAVAVVLLLGMDFTAMQQVIGGLHSDGMAVRL